MGLAPYGDPQPHLSHMRDLVHEKGPLFELGLDYFTHHKEGVDMTWDERTPTIGRIYSEQMVERFGPPRAAGEEVTKLHHDVRGLAPARARGDLPARPERAAGANGSDERDARRRCRAERRRERADPSRDARSTTSTSSRQRATPGPRSAARTTSGTRCSGSRAGS